MEGLLFLTNCYIGVIFQCGKKLINFFVKLVDNPIGLCYYISVLQNKSGFEKIKKYSKFFLTDGFGYAIV